MKSLYFGIVNLLFASSLNSYRLIFHTTQWQKNTLDIFKYNPNPRILKTESAKLELRWHWTLTDLETFPTLWNLKLWQNTAEAWIWVTEAVTFIYLQFTKPHQVLMYI